MNRHHGGMAAPGRLRPTSTLRPGGRAAAPAGLVATALGAVYVLWGSTYLGIRVALDNLPPYTLGAIRFLVAGPLMYAVAVRLARRRGRPEPRPTARQWAAQSLVGILLLGVGNGGVILAEQSVPTGLVALLVATVPLWMALFGGLVLGEPFSRRAVVSVVLGFAGVGLLIRPGGAASLPVMLAVLIAPLTWSIGSLYARRAPRPHSPLVGAGMQMSAAGVVFAVAALIAGEPWHGGGIHPTGRGLLAVAYLITFGSLVGYTAYAWLLQVVPVSLVSTYAYVNPLVAVLLGAVFLSEQITARVLIGGGIVAVAVALLLSASGPRRSTASADVVGAPAQLPGRAAACDDEVSPPRSA